MPMRVNEALFPVMFACVSSQRFSLSFSFLSITSTSYRRMKEIYSIGSGMWWMKSWTWGGRYWSATLLTTGWRTSNSTSRRDWTGVTSEYRTTGDVLHRGTEMLNFIGWAPDTNSRVEFRASMNWQGFLLQPSACIVGNACKVLSLIGL